jgi:hypothetical protein
MRRLMNSVFFAGLLLGATIAGAPPAALAANQDGNWSVLIITEKGNCDRGYRYDVKVASGHVSYQGDAAVDMNGTVAADGAVKVNIRLGEKGANGTGRLSGQSGTGTWHAAAASSNCAGRWVAERR